MQEGGQVQITESIARAVADYLNAIAKQSNADAESRAEHADAVSTAAVEAFQAHVAAAAAHARAVIAAEAAQIAAHVNASADYHAAVISAGAAAGQAVAHAEHAAFTGLIAAEAAQLTADEAASDACHQSVTTAAVTLNAALVTAAVAYWEETWATVVERTTAIANAQVDSAARHHEEVGTAESQWFAATVAVSSAASIAYVNVGATFQTAVVAADGAWSTAVTSAEGTYYSGLSSTYSTYFASSIGAVAAHGTTHQDINRSRTLGISNLWTTYNSATRGNAVTWWSTSVTAAQTATTASVATGQAYADSTSAAMLAMYGSLVQNELRVIQAGNMAGLDLTDSALQAFSDVVDGVTITSPSGGVDLTSGVDSEIRYQLAGIGSVEGIVAAIPFGATADAHHWVPGAVVDKIGNLISSAAGDLFEKGKTGPLPYPHGNDTWNEITHPKYSDAVEELLRAFKHQVSPNKALGETDARAFLEWISSGQIPEGSETALNKVAKALPEAVDRVTRWRAGFRESWILADAIIDQAKALNQELDPQEVKQLTKAILNRTNVDDLSDGARKVLAGMNGLGAEGLFALLKRSAGKVLPLLALGSALAAAQDGYAEGVNGHTGIPGAVFGVTRDAVSADLVEQLAASTANQVGEWLYDRNADWLSIKKARYPQLRDLLEQLERRPSP